MSPTCNFTVLGPVAAPGMVYLQQVYALTSAQDADTLELKKALRRTSPALPAADGGSAADQRDEGDAILASVNSEFRLLTLKQGNDSPSLLRRGVTHNGASQIPAAHAPS